MLQIYINFVYFTETTLTYLHHGAESFLRS